MVNTNHITTQMKRPAGVAQLIESLNWDAIHVELDAYGAAVIGPLLSPEQWKNSKEAISN